MKKIFKTVYWVIHYEDLPDEFFLDYNFLSEFVFENKIYFPIKSCLLFGLFDINLIFARNKFGPYDSFDEAKQICDFFNSED